MMRTYAHWLDGDYRTALTGVTRDALWSPADDQAERLLKVSALFGAGFDLSDVQIVDSPVLWRQFAQPAFRQFLSVEPQFLRLVARPVTTHADRRWSLAGAGLERALIAGRIGSPMHDEFSVLRVADEILTAGPEGDLTAILTNHRRSPDFDLLSGFVESFRFFSSGPGQVSPPPAGRPYHTYYSVLELALNNSELVGADRRVVEDTLHQVDEMVEDPAERVKRINVSKNLDLANPVHLARWRIVVQAWNVAAQKSVSIAGGSITGFETVPIAAYVDHPVDLMLGANAPIRNLKTRLGKALPQLGVNWDPGTLEWSDIRKICEDSRDLGPGRIYSARL